jgi:CHAT domain
VETDFVSAGADVWRVVTSDGRAEARLVADHDTVVRLGRLARAERAMALRPGRAPEEANESLLQLDALLFPEHPRPGRLRISYPSALAAIPWTALPTLKTAEWAVSAAVVAALEPGPPRRDAGLSVIVGPDVPNGADEARAVRDCYPDGRLFDGPEATIASACQRLSAPGVVHVAAHAGRRGDDPTLSWIDLADGRLTCRDLRRTAIRADCVVLAACDAATPAGDLAAGVVTPARTLLAGGAAAVIAPTEPVEHVATTAFLTTVHRGLAQGLEPARALAQARREHVGSTAAGSFVCLVASV